MTTKNNKLIFISIALFLIAIFSVLVFGLFNNHNKNLEKSKRQSESEFTKTEEQIKNSFLQKFPEWEKNDFNLAIKKKSSGHAMGLIFWPKREAGSYWFAAKTDNQWIITDYGGTGYFGVCQNFAKFKFPAEMTPDCWDNDQGILINTPNPGGFYNGLTVDDKLILKEAFLSFTNNQYRNQDFYIRFEKNSGEYLQGAILFGGAENHSASKFFAVKDNGTWKILYYGQENPACSDIKEYNFPIEIIPECWDGENWTKR